MTLKKRYSKGNIYVGNYTDEGWKKYQEAIKLYEESQPYLEAERKMWYGNKFNSI